MNGYAGKILRLNLTTRDISAIATKDYEHWGGGHGMGSAIFWDLVKNKAISGFDPSNVVTIMTSPLTGTLVPGAAGRSEVQGIGVQSSPIEWFTRSNFGGRFGAMLKYAGWDGIAIEGRAEKPVWLDIRDTEVKIRDASHLWGQDTWQTQQEIWREVGTDSKYGGWAKSRPSRSYEESTQRPAVLTIGPAGEHLCRIASLIHDAGHGSGQGGFGAVWGSKNLKAISVIGMGGIKIANPNALMEARLWAQQNYAFDLDNPRKLKEIKKTLPLGFGAPGGLPAVFWVRPEGSRPSACVGCHSGCRSRYDTGQGNESSCASTAFYSHLDQRRHSGMALRATSSILEHLGQKGASFGVNIQYGKQTSAGFMATDLAQKYGINTIELMQGLPYLLELDKMGVIGPGKEIDCDLPFDQLGEFAFAEKLLRMIAYREGIGDDLAEGFYRAAGRWGRLEEDSASGLLLYPYWGLPDHYDPRAEVEWGYGSLLGDRDINEHDFNVVVHWLPTFAKWNMSKPPISAEEMTRIIAEKLKPYEGDPLMLDCSTDNIYSEHMVKLVAWHRHYGRFWKQSALFCDYRFADFYNANRPDKRGMTGEGEPRFFNAVTGGNLSFVDGMELGRKIWNLDNAIWTLQGRHKDMVHFADYIYKVPFPGIGSLTKYYMTGRKKGKWQYLPLEGRHIDRAGFEEWKTGFYEFEGWDPNTGWPRRNTLESLGLGYIADELESQGKLARIEE